MPGCSVSGELHKHKWTFEKKHDKAGYIRNNCIEPQSMQARHDLLAEEMQSRGYKHNSPYTAPDISYLPNWQRDYVVNVEDSIRDLKLRCKECFKGLDT